MAIDTAEEITPDSIRERLKVIGQRDSATAAEPVSEASGAAPITVSPAAGAAPAAPNPAPTPAPATSTPEPDWWNGETVTHTMLRSATGPDVEKMFKHGQSTIKAQAEKIKRLEALTSPPAQQAAPPAPQSSTADDPRRLEYEAAYYSGDMRRAIEIQREWAREEVAAVLAQRDEQATTQQRMSAASSAARTSITAIATDYGADPDFVEYRFLSKVLPEMNRYATEQVFVDFGGESGDPVQVARAEEARRLFMSEPQNWRDVYAAMFGQPPTAAPTPTIGVPAVPQRATPPHSMAVAPAAPPPKLVRQPALDATLDRRLSLLSDGILDEAQSAAFKQRVASRAAK